MKSAGKKRKVVRWGVFKKTLYFRYPGEWWEEINSERTARNRFEKEFGSKVFRLVKITYEEA